MLSLPLGLTRSVCSWATRTQALELGKGEWVACGANVAPVALVGSLEYLIILFFSNLTFAIFTPPDRQTDKWATKQDHFRRHSFHEATACFKVSSFEKPLLPVVVAVAAERLASDRRKDDYGHDSWQKKR